MRRISVFLILLLLPTFLGSPVGQYELPEVYFEKANLFERAFTEPFEIMVFISAYGHVYILSNHADYEVKFSTYFLEQRLKEDGIALSDIVLIVHNHWTGAMFSPEDISTLYRLKQRGFKGAFALFSNTQRSVVKVIYPSNLK